MAESFIFFLKCIWAYNFIFLYYWTLYFYIHSFRRIFYIHASSPSTNKQTTTKFYHQQQTRKKNYHHHQQTITTATNSPPPSTNKQTKKMGMAMFIYKLCIPKARCRNKGVIDKLLCHLAWSI